MQLGQYEQHSNCESHSEDPRMMLLLQGSQFRHSLCAILPDSHTSVPAGMQGGARSALEGAQCR